MGVISFPAEAYARVQKFLLPPGRLWSLTPGSVLSLVFLAVGDELARVSGRAADMIVEADGSTTTELLTDFERELALTDPGALSDADRRLRITAKEVQEPSFKPLDVRLALAPYLDIPLAEVVMLETSNATAIANGDETTVYRFYIHPDTAYGGSADVIAAQAELDSMSHSHTQGFVIVSVSLLCDDADSLTDRDLLGV